MTRMMTRTASATRGSDADSDSLTGNGSDLLDYKFFPGVVTVTVPSQ